MRPFALERLFARHEFTAKRLLSSSDPEAVSQARLLRSADAECKKLWRELKLGYTESQGHPLLLREIAKLYSGVKPEEILEIAPQEGILLAMRALIKKGDHVVCVFPGYQSLYEVALSAGAEIDFWKPREDAGRWRFHVSDLARILRPDTKLIVVNFPHNPTGSLLDKNELGEIVRLAKKRGAWIFSDEMYRGLELERESRLPSVCELYAKSATLSGLSKTHGLPGLRIGWLVVSDGKLRAKLKEGRDYTTICSSAPSQILAIMGMRAGKSLVDGHRRRITRNLALMEKFCAGKPDVFAWRAPRAGTVAFPRLLAAKSASAFCARLMKESGVFLAPSTAFEFGDSHVRIGLGRADFPKALARLARAVAGK